MAPIGYQRASCVDSTAHGWLDFRVGWVVVVRVGGGGGCFLINTWIQLALPQALLHSAAKPGVGKIMEVFFWVWGRACPCLLSLPRADGIVGGHSSGLYSMHRVKWDTVTYVKLSPRHESIGECRCACAVHYSDRVCPCV